MLNADFYDSSQENMTHHFSTWQNGFSRQHGHACDGLAMLSAFENGSPAIYGAFRSKERLQGLDVNLVELDRKLRIESGWRRFRNAST